jgi:hypothetical protein
VDQKEKEIISFKEAHERFDFIFNKELLRAQEAFGVKYDTKDVLRRTWDTAQVALSEHYRPLHNSEVHRPVLDTTAKHAPR